jgi:hypothetical protein
MEIEKVDHAHTVSRLIGYDLATTIILSVHGFLPTKHQEILDDIYVEKEKMIDI